MKSLIAGIAALVLLPLSQAYATSDIMCSVARAGQMCIPDKKVTGRTGGCGFDGEQSCGFTAAPTPTTHHKRWFSAIDEPVGDGSQCKEHSEDELVSEFGHFRADPPEGGYRFVTLTEKTANRVLFLLGETWSANDGNPTHSVKTTMRAGWFKSHDECVNWAPPD